MSEQRCQSCGMPLGEEEYFGTNKDGSINEEYCKFCFADGKFSDESITLKDMIASSVKHMTSELGFSKEMALQLSEKVIPNLKRWKKR